MADGSVVIQVTADDKDAQKKLNDLRRAIDKTTKAIDTTGGKKAAITEQLEQARKEAEATARVINEIQAQKMENDAALSGQAGDVSLEEFEARRQAQDEINVELQTQQKLLASQEAAVAKLEAKEREKTAQLEQQTAQLEQQKAAAGEVERVVAAQASSAMPQLAASAEDVSKAMRKGFKNILKWGFGIRSVFVLFRRLRSAIIEGVKAFAESDEETKSNINSLKSALTTLKASWGAAFAPVFNAVVPILQKLISWLTTAANAVAMFFSAITGKGSYKKAIAANNDLAESYGGAGGAAKDAQKEIMGFDEINKLNGGSDGGGGGGGGAGSDVAQQFEEVKILDSFKKHLDDILIIAGLIGAALLAWKLAPLLGVAFKTIFGILMAIIGAIELIHGGMDAWINGLNWDNLLDMLKGAALIVGGLALAFGATGAAIGLLIAGVALLVIGFHEWITTGELTSQTLTALIIGFALVGVGLGILIGQTIAATAGIALLAIGIGLLVVGIIEWIKTGELSQQTFQIIMNGILLIAGGIALLTGSWIPLLIGAIAMIALTVYKNWDKIKTWTSNLVSSVVNKWNQLKDGVSNAWNSVVDWFHQKWDDLQAWWSSLSLGAFHIPHPVFDWTYKEATGLLAKAMEFVGIPPTIPSLQISWYARGGIVDGATLIGAGEAGKEAIVPLERNTEWIQMVADGLVDRLTSNNRLSDYVSRMPIPALVGGQVVPPRAISGGGSFLTDGDIDRLVSGIMAALGGDSGFGEQSIKLYLDGRQIAETVSKHQRRMGRGNGA